MEGRLSLHLTRGYADGHDITPPGRSAFYGDSIPLTSSPQGPRSIPFGPRSPYPGSIPLPSEVVIGASNPLASEAIGPLPLPVAPRSSRATGSLTTAASSALGPPSTSEPAP